MVDIPSRVATELAGRAYSAAIAEHARGALIDLGCGDVPCYGMYRSQAESVTCVDWIASPHECAHLDLVADLNKPLPLKGSSFDTAILTDVLEHVVYPEQVWRELARILRPNGVAIVGVPFMYWLHEQPHDYYRYTEFRLRRFCEDAGFDVVRLSATGGPSAVAADIALRAISRFMPRWIVRSASRLALAALPDVDDLPAMPIGYLLVARRISNGST